jgi:hypothetical protein
MPTQGLGGNAGRWGSAAGVVVVVELEVKTASNSEGELLDVLK